MDPSQKITNENQQQNQEPIQNDTKTPDKTLEKIDSYQNPQKILHKQYFQQKNPIRLNSDTKTQAKKSKQINNSSEKEQNISQQQEEIQENQKNLSQQDDDSENDDDQKSIKLILHDLESENNTNDNKNLNQKDDVMIVTQESYYNSIDYQNQSQKQEDKNVNSIKQEHREQNNDSQQNSNDQENNKQQVEQQQQETEKQEDLENQQQEDEGEEEVKETIKDLFNEDEDEIWTIMENLIKNNPISQIPFEKKQRYSIREDLHIIFGYKKQFDSQKKKMKGKKVVPIQLGEAIFAKIQKDGYILQQRSKGSVRDRFRIYLQFLTKENLTEIFAYIEKNNIDCLIEFKEENNQQEYLRCSYKRKIESLKNQKENNLKQPQQQKQQKNDSSKKQNTEKQQQPSSNDLQKNKNNKQQKDNDIKKQPQQQNKDKNFKNLTAKKNTEKKHYNIFNKKQNKSATNLRIQNDNIDNSNDLDVSVVLIQKSQSYQKMQEEKELKNNKNKDSENTQDNQLQELKLQQQLLQSNPIFIFDDSHFQEKFSFKQLIENTKQAVSNSPSIPINQFQNSNENNNSFYKNSNEHYFQNHKKSNNNNDSLLLEQDEQQKLKNVQNHDPNPDILIEKIQDGQYKFHKKQSFQAIKIIKNIQEKYPDLDLQDEDTKKTLKEYLHTVSNDFGDFCYLYDQNYIAFNKNQINDQSQQDDEDKQQNNDTNKIQWNDDEDDILNNAQEQKSMFNFLVRYKGSDRVLKRLQFLNINLPFKFPSDE